MDNKGAIEDSCRVTSEKAAASGSAELMYVPGFLDGHTLEVAVVGVKHHRGDLIH